MMQRSPAIRDYAHLLPEVGQELVTLIGLDATLALVTACGGSTFPVPHGKNPEGAVRLAFLTKICGEDAAKALAKRYGGTRVYIPNCKHVLRRIRNIAMIREFNHRRDAGESALTIIADMAPRYRLADRNIWDIVNKTVEAEWSRLPNAESGQLSLV